MASYGGLNDASTHPDVEQGTVREPKKRCSTKMVIGLSLVGVAFLVGAVAFASYRPSADDSGSSPVLRRGAVEYDLPWEAVFTPEGDMLYTEKCGGLSVLTTDGQTTRLLDSSPTGLAPDFFCLGQAGMHGVALDPNFGATDLPHNHDIYVFMASNTSTADVRVRSTNRVVRLTLAERITDPVVARVDIVSDIFFKDEANDVGGPGAHSGGRIGFGLRGTAWAATLFITSGDNHNATLPQDLFALGAKVLAVDRDGLPDPGNRIGPPEGDARIFTYGQRNIQGIAFRPGTDQVFIAEHGPNHSDEVTKLQNGGNGGWDPKDRPGLDCPSDYCGYAGDPETMPMTDVERFPDALVPVWNMEERSAGMGPCVFLQGPQWREYEGWLAVGVMGGLPIREGDQTVVLLQLSEDGNDLLNVAYPASIDKARYRSLVIAPSGNLLVVIERRVPNGGDIYEITPDELLQF